MSGVPVIHNYEVELPAGGTLHLQTPDEVRYWNESLERYRQDYTLAKQNDLIALGQLLQQAVILFRCQTQINGMEPEVDASNVPTGAYRRVELDAADLMAYQKAMTAASDEMRKLEKQLGIDKATREQGGSHTVDSYVRALKLAAQQRGIHIVTRTLEYEKVVNEVRVRLRLLYEGDEEDRKYHDVTPRSVLDWLRGECDRLAEVDKKFNREKGKLFVGQL